MKKFSELGIRSTQKRLKGEKIKISKILNREITVRDYRLETSKFGKNKSGKCLYLQIELEKNNHSRGEFIMPPQDYELWDGSNDQAYSYVATKINVLIL